MAVYGVAVALGGEQSQLTRDRGLLSAGRDGAESRREVVLDPAGEPELWASIPPIAEHVRAHSTANASRSATASTASLTVRWIRHMEA
jgi:hypothetical protein